MANFEREILSPCEQKIKFLKWKVRKGSIVYKGSVLALYSVVTESENENAPVSKLKAKEGGTVDELVAQEDEVILPKAVILKMRRQSDQGQACSHPTIMKDMCACCGADLRKESEGTESKSATSASVAMVHNIPELVVSQEQAMELGKKDETRLLRERKLVLLVDLDQTLIHTTNDPIPPNLKDVKHFEMWDGRGYMWYHTRFRPFTQQFLERVSKMYELHICTFGVRMYAHTIARFMDPEGKLFSHRILSRDECFDSLSKTANLKALFPCGDKMVGIIDDREDVWNFAPNLIHVKAYRFFQGTADINAPPGLTKSENDNIPIVHKTVNAADSDSKKNMDSENKTGEEGDIKKEDKKETDEVKGQDVEKDSVKDENTATSNIKDNSSENVDMKSNSDLPKEERVLEKQVSDKKTGGEENVELVQKASGDPKCEENVKGIITQSKEQNEREGCNQKTTPNDKTDKNNSEKAHVAMMVENSEDKSQDNACVKSAGNDNGDSSNATDKKDEKDKSVESDRKDEIEWDDSDDYLLHLEEILTRIHKAYYNVHDQLVKAGSSQLPDLKNIIPYVKKKVLKGANIVFSGMFPVNMPPEKSRAYMVAKSLGAEVQSDIVPKSKSKKSQASSEATTHLVAARAGTGKHKSALKAKVQVVSGDWLWACSERWEWVSEQLFLLPRKSDGQDEEEEKEVKGKKKGGKRKRTGVDKKKDGKESDNKEDEEGDDESNNEESSPSKKKKESSEEKKEKKFADSYNPFLSFSNEDIEFMDKEVNEMMDDGQDESEESDQERNERMRRKVLGRLVDSDDSDSDSLSGDFPRGWKLRRKSLSPQHKTVDVYDEIARRSNQEEGEETENELERYQKTVDTFAGESDRNSDSSGDSIGSVDEEMAAAVEREFLGAL